MKTSEKMKHSPSSSIMELFLWMQVRSVLQLWIICVVIFWWRRGEKARGRLFNLLYCTSHITPGVTVC